MVDTTPLPSDNFSQRKSFVLKVVTITSGSLSIAAVTVLLWFIYSRPIKTRKFRHYLLLTLLQYDLLKAVFLMTYPIRHFNDTDPEEPPSGFCNAIGFFVALTIEGADFAVLHLALHTAVTIFGKPYNRHNLLFRFRWFTYGLSVIFAPFLLASLGFIGGYYGWTTMCYFPVFPIWHRLVLSWIPRCIIICIICAVYIAIYFRVKRQIEGLAVSLSHSLPRVNIPSPDGSSTSQNQLFDFLLSGGSKKAFKQLRIWASQFPGFAFLSPYTIEVPIEGSTMSLSDDESQSISPPQSIEQRHGSNRQSTLYTLPPIVPEIICRTQQSTLFDQSEQLQLFIQTENYHRFENQRAIIEQQLSLMFVYPIAYVLIWIFPLAEECLNFQFRANKPYNFWVIVLARWMVPFSGFVDAIIFLLKEIFLISNERASGNNSRSFGGGGGGGFTDYSQSGNFTAEEPNMAQREPRRLFPFRSAPYLPPIDTTNWNVRFNLTRWNQSVPHSLDGNELGPTEEGGRGRPMLGQLRKYRKTSAIPVEEEEEDDGDSMDFLQFLHSSNF